MDKVVHDMRNDLAVAIGNIHAFLDRKLEPSQRNLQRVLESLEDLDTLISELRIASRTGSAEQEQLLNAVVEGSPYATVLVNERGRIMLVNAQTEALFGYTRDELLGQSIEMLVPERFQRGHPGLRDAFNATPVARAMGAGRDLYGRRKDGNELPIEIGLNPIKTDTGSFTLAAITNISERRRAEELRLRHAGIQQHAVELEELNRELASASRFKTQFVATMSHELRTPLSAIIAASELLNRATLAAREGICVQTIAEAAEALFGLINSILDFSKIEAGRMDLHPVPLEVEAVLESAAEVVAQLARDKGITLYTYVDPLIPAVEGDRDRLRQILLNLLGNAIKFTERGRIVARALLLETMQGDSLVRFEVKDTGIGIAPDELSHLFEPFAQADSSASRNVAGTGLGLSISKRLVELMGGEIGVESKPGSGSLFWFTARLARTARSGASQRRTLEGIGGLILTADDLVADIIDRYMTSWSMESRRARHRDDVIAALQSNDLTWVVIVDLDESGIADIGATLEVLRALFPARIISIGSEGELQKPLRQSHMFDAVVKAVGGNRVDAPAIVPTNPVELLPRPNERVLVAEDNVQLQQLLKLQFDDIGVMVTFVEDGLQVIDALQEEQYSLLFMDCQMPRMDGLTATKRIRDEERRSGGHIPIVAMTAHAFAEDRDECIAAGMDDYLAKPVKLADLTAVINRWAGPAVRG